MSMRLTKDAYAALIAEDIRWLLLETEKTLERDHIVEVLRFSIEQHYPDGSHILRTPADDTLE